jgi:hypothetical protein
MRRRALPNEEATILRLTGKPGALNRSAIQLRILGGIAGETLKKPV